MQLLDVLKPLSLHLGLADRTFLPIPLSSLIPADVDVFRREHLKDFRKDILQEIIDLLVARTELLHILQMLFSFGIQARKERISGDALKVMAGHLDLRNHLDMAF